MKKMVTIILTRLRLEFMECNKDEEVGEAILIMWIIYKLSYYENGHIQ